MRAPILTLALAVLGCGRDAKGPEGGEAPRPPPGRAATLADDWTHAELAAHLKEKGVEVAVVHAPLFDRPDRPAAFFRKPGESGNYVLVYRYPDAKGAREAAGGMGDGAFAKGRFAFGNHNRSKSAAELMERIKAALD